MKLLRLFILVLALPFTGCEKDIMDYEGVEGVYFAVQHGSSWGNERTWPYQPYSNVEFVKSSLNELTIQVKVMVTGPAKDYDRLLNVEINPDSTTAVEGIHFNALPNQFVIPAGALFVNIPVELKRAADLKKTMKMIGLRLIANDNFQLSFPDWDAIPAFSSGTIVKKFDASLHSIRINDFMVQPAVWIGSIQQGNMESGQWGAFSQKKIELMCQVMDLTYEDFSSTQTMPSILSGLVASTCARYLIARYEAGTPILEEDGRLMFIGNVPWTTYIGIPYIPKP